MWANAQRDGRPAEYRWRGALCSTPQSLADAHCTTRVACSNAAKTRKPLKFAGMPQTPEPISAASGPKFTILWRHVEDKFFFPIVDVCLSCEEPTRQNCAMVPRWRFFAPFLRPVFPPSLVQHISEMHSKFALGPHHV